MPDKQEMGGKSDPASAAGSNNKTPERSSEDWFTRSAIVTLLSVLAIIWWLDFDINYAFCWVATFLSFWLIVPLAFGVGRRRGWRRVAREVASAFVGAAVASFIYLLVCNVMFTVRYSSAEAAPKFANSYFAAVDKNNTGYVTSNQLFAILAEQRELRGILRYVDEAERNVKESANVPPAVREAIVQHYEAIRQNIVPSQLPQEEVDTIAALSDVCFAGEKIDNGKDCRVSRDQLLGYKTKVEQSYPNWISVMRRYGLLD